MFHVEHICGTFCGLVPNGTSHILILDEKSWAKFKTKNNGVIDTLVVSVWSEIPPGE